MCCNDRRISIKQFDDHRKKPEGSVGINQQGRTTTPPWSSGTPLLAYSNRKELALEFHCTLFQKIIMSAASIQLDFAHSRRWTNYCSYSAAADC